MKKNNLFLTGLLALSLVFVTVFTGCESVKAWAEQDDLTDAIRAGSDELNKKVSQGSKVAFLNFTSKSPELSEYIIQELINNGVSDGVFTVVDRQNLAQLQQEMDFQLSGEVSDSSAQSIGQKLGAQFIVSGSITAMGTNYSFRLSAINVETAAIVATYSKNISYSALINKLGGDAMKPEVPAAAPAVPAAPATPAGPTVPVVVAPVTLSGAWQQDLMGSAWGTWVFNENAYFYYFFEETDEPDEAGTFTFTADTITFNPTEKLTLQGTYNSYSRKYEFTPSGTLKIMNSKGERMDEYKKIEVKRLPGAVAVAPVPIAPPAPVATPAPVPPPPPVVPPAPVATSVIAGLNTWTKSNASVFTGAVNGIAYNGNRGSPKYIAVGESGKMAESTDGTTWTAITGFTVPIANTGILKGIIYAPSGQFMTIYSQGTGTTAQNRIFASSGTGTSGVAWSNAAPGNVNPATVWSAITVNSRQIVVVGDRNTVIVRSSTEIPNNWTVLTSATNKSPIADITAVAGNADGTKYIVGGRNGMIAYTGAALSASTTWTTLDDTPFGEGAINAAVYGGDKFVAVGAGGKIAYSTDGTTWKAVSGSPVGSGDVVSVAYGTNTFVAAGASGKLAYSTDGITWTASTSTDFSSLSSVSAVGSRFVVGSTTLTGLSGTVSQ